MANAPIQLNALKKKKKGKKKLSADEKKKLKVQLSHKKIIRSIFTECGFNRIPSASDKEIVYDGQKTDLDDIFVDENILLLVEYTVAQSKDVGDHLKVKSIPYGKIAADHSAFVAFMRATLADLKESSLKNYLDANVIVRIIYCSLNDFDVALKENVPVPCYLDYPIARYFKSVADSIRRSARFEILDFLGIDLKKVGVNGAILAVAGANKYEGSILPEAHSHFKKGHKIVSFYADPSSLLRRAYVLRKDGWRESINLYQRMISRNKIESIRRYLKNEKRVFVNNMIVTLPDDTKALDADGNTVDPKTLNEVSPITIQIPDRAGCVGIVDGQHRLYSYHETLIDDPEIAILRKQQNLLVTGIVYPKNTSNSEKEKFEAKLFLEINSTQANAKSSLKQAIAVILDPFSSGSIATRVLSGMGKTGPLGGYIESYFYETDKLKTTSIVSYGMKPLVKTTGSDTLFALWQDPDKDAVKNGLNDEALTRYVKFAVSHINMFLSAVKNNVDDKLWTTDKKVIGHLLNTTHINAFLITLRLIVDANKAGDFAYYKQALKGIGAFPFKQYHSSQYGKMARKVMDDFFP